ncbi:hypothetical protein [Polymorphobacter fuscus]|uniref:Uncharacterized protein n=1 Tax=Sandarakinorhabdus fusca TaxID=1439888 RepID=A0A7C9KYR2_9SPHN|nr:hypothetical protein [Polymorphobacter fuscus]KAB7643919.1 hypothetical protein F9290_15320 [Polymorphobacter fuscus]MQT18622.1 hypothetical protein [Polymorphobacter fuscus]NJC07011.1 hypothetical protein [Polymorphobacter fuscus]
MKLTRYSFIPFVAVLMLGACSRPDAVRLAAQSAAPIASDFHAALPPLEQRLAIQLKALDLDRSDNAKRAGVSQASLAREQRLMALESEAVAKERTRQFNLLTADSTAVRADPFTFVQATLPSKLPENAVPTKSLDQVIASLSSIAKARSWGFSETAAFLGAVQTERERIAKEAQPKAP